MFTVKFWTEALERAVKSGAQGIIAAIGVNAVGLADVDWQAAAGAGALLAVLSVLTSVASTPFGPKGDPSLVSVTPPA